VQRCLLRARVQRRAGGHALRLCAHGQQAPRHLDVKLAQQRLPGLLPQHHQPLQLVHQLQGARDELL
jgi:hypothetical protein